MNEKLTLRGTNSPFTGIYEDINKGSVLSHSELDNNFIFLKGHIIYDVTLDFNTLIFKKLNGDDLSLLIDLNTTQLTGGTYNNNTGAATFTNSTGGTFDVTGFFKPSDDVYVTGMTFNLSNYELSIDRNDGVSFAQDLTILASDMTITGGTYDINSGVVTFTNNTGGTFTVNGFLTGMTDTYWVSGSTGDYSIKANNNSGLDATGDYSVAEGYNSTASGDYSFIHSKDSVVKGNRSVVLGGVGITGNSDDTVYVPYLNVQSATTNNNLTEILVLDTNGDIKKRDVSSIFGDENISPISVVNTSSLFSTRLLNTGLNASGVTYSNFFGDYAGANATNATYSNFFGNYAGAYSTNAYNSNFFGESAGANATNAKYSNFFGGAAGANATNASYSNFFGKSTGAGAINASLSNLIGYRVGYTINPSDSIGSNNIIIGTNINLSAETKDSINIGGVLFGTGTYSVTTGDTLTVPVSDGRIGIGVVTPLERLHVGGNLLVDGSVSATTYYNLPITIDTHVTGATYSNNTFTYTNNTGGTFNVLFNTLTGLTINGNLNITGNTNLNTLSANTISATTYYNLPSEIYVTGGTYNQSSGITTFTNNSGGTFNVSGYYTGYTPTIDIYTTGATYSNNTFTYTNNTGGTFDVLFNTLTGLTINGNLNVTGDTILNTLSANTITGTTIYATDFPQLPYTDNETIEVIFSGSDSYVKVKDVVSAPSGGTRTFNGNVIIGSNLTASTVSATTYYNLPTEIYVTGGTYNQSSGIATFTNNSGGTFDITGFNTGYTPTIDVYTTGATYSDNTFTYTNNTGGTFNVLFNTLSGLTINGNFNVTGNTNLNTLTASTISATTYYNLPTEIYVTGGTYNNTTGIATFTNNSGGTFNITGFNTGYTPTIDIYTTGATYANNTFTYTNNTGGTFNVLFNTLTGLTINGNLNVTGDTTLNTLSANTISATTITGETIYAIDFPQLPYTDNDTVEIVVSGSSSYLKVKDVVSAPSGGTRTFNGNVNIISGLSASTISATTYYNLPTSIDTYVTGATYSNNAFTYTNNSGGTFDVLFDTLTGLTINGNLNVTGNTVLNTLSANTISATTFYGDGSNLTNVTGTATKFSVTCRNQSGADLYKGMIVYISGSTGNKPTIGLSKASSEATSARTFGVLEEDIANNADGSVLTIGSIQTLDTRTNATHPFTVDTLSDGDTLYLSSTNAGYVTNIKPHAPSHLVYIGKVIRTTPTNGYIQYQIQNGFEIDELHDVMTTGATFGDILSFSAFNGTNVWTSSKTLNGSYTITGNTTVNGQMKAGSVSATTYYNLPTDIYTTGGTYNNTTGIATFTNNSGGTFNVSGFKTNDIFVTGATYSNNTFTYTNNTGGTFNVLFNILTGLTINGNFNVTGDTNLNVLSTSTISATTITGNTVYAVDFPQLPYADNETVEIVVSGSSSYARLKDIISAPSGGTRTFNGNVNIISGLSASTISATTYYNLPTSIDTYVTGGTYNNNTGVATFTNNSGGTFNVSGFKTNDIFVTGATYSNNTFTYTNNTGGTFNVLFNTLTGLTINGNLNVTGNTNLNVLSASTISATTITGNTVYAVDFPQLPYTDNDTVEIIVSGSSSYLKVKDVVSAPTGGTRTFNGNINIISGLSATTISATTYYNLPTSIDTYVTGGTYNSGTITFRNNSGGTFNVTGLVTGDTYFVSGSTGTNSIKAINNTGLDATGDGSYAQGNNTKAIGNYSHSDGINTISGAKGFISNTEIINGLVVLDSSYGDVTSQFSGGLIYIDGVAYAYNLVSYSSPSTEITLTNQFATPFGESFIIIPYNNLNSQYADVFTGDYSHAEGNGTKAIGISSHAEGSGTRASGISSHAEGENTVASGNYSHAEGSGTIASGNYSHAEGSGTIASGNYTHAEGNGTIAYSDYQTVVGNFNTTNNSSQLFIVGNGTNTSTRSNALRVSSNGNLNIAGTLTQGSADYAEFFESLNGERLPFGTVVELSNGKLIECQDANNAIGVISSKPMIVGNAEDGTADEWVGKYLKDDWGNYIYEEYEYTEIDKDGNGITKIGIRKKLNPNYDSSVEYVKREDRPEWNIVGLLGQIRILKNQQIPSRWIKLYDINNDIAMYLVR